jgi:hypothetical protein
MFSLAVIAPCRAYIIMCTAILEDSRMEGGLGCGLCKGALVRSHQSHVIHWYSILFRISQNMSIRFEIRIPILAADANSVGLYLQPTQSQ